MPQLVKEEIAGILEIDRESGTIYFHTNNPDVAKRWGTVTPFRLGHIPPERMPETGQMDFVYGPDKDRVRTAEEAKKEDLFVGDVVMWKGSNMRGTIELPPYFNGYVQVNIEGGRSVVAKREDLIVITEH